MWCSRGKGGEGRMVVVVVFFREKAAYELRISDWSTDVCSSDLFAPVCHKIPSRRDIPAGSFLSPVLRFHAERNDRLDLTAIVVAVSLRGMGGAFDDLA